MGCRPEGEFTVNQIQPNYRGLSTDLFMLSGCIFIYHFSICSTCVRFVKHMYSNLSIGAIVLNERRWNNNHDHYKHTKLLELINAYLPGSNQIQWRRCSEGTDCQWLSIFHHVLHSENLMHKSQHEYYQFQILDHY